MKTKWKVIIAVILAVVISVGSISAYKYITSPKEERCGGTDYPEDDHLRCIQKHKG